MRVAKVDETGVERHKFRLRNLLDDDSHSRFLLVSNREMIQLPSEKIRFRMRGLSLSTIIISKISKYSGTISKIYIVPE